MNQTAARGIAIVVAIAFLYPLSGGLLVWLDANDLIGDWMFGDTILAKLLGAYIEPLDWLHDNVPLYQRFIEACGS